MILYQGPSSDSNTLKIVSCFNVPSSTTGVKPNQLSLTNIPARTFQFDSSKLYVDCFIFDDSGRHIITMSENSDVLDFSCLFGIDCSSTDSSGLYGYGIRMSGLKKSSTFLKPATYEYAMMLDLEPGEHQALFVIGPTRVTPYTDTTYDWKSAFGTDIQEPLGPVDLTPSQRNSGEVTS